MYSLYTFYRSKEWRRLLDILKNERLNDQGEIICSYCGKPIVRAYDIIGHHKHELTEENVNDFNISLNPDNVELVHHRCHNYWRSACVPEQIYAWWYGTLSVESVFSHAGKCSHCLSVLFTARNFSRNNLAGVNTDPVRLRFSGYTPFGGVSY